MKIERFTVEYKETRSGNYQSATAGLSVECVLEEGDDFDTEFAKVRTDAYKRVSATAQKALQNILASTEPEESDTPRPKVRADPAVSGTNPSARGSREPGDPPRAS